MPWNRARLPISGVPVHRVPPAFTQEFAAVGMRMFQQITAFHQVVTRISSFTTFLPAISRSASSRLAFKMRATASLRFSRFVQRLPLSVCSGQFLDVADPPVSVLFENGREVVIHKSPCLANVNCSSYRAATVDFDIRAGFEASNSTSRSISALVRFSVTAISRQSDNSG